MLRAMAAAVRNGILGVLSALILVAVLPEAQAAEGFYKDVFMDGGRWLTHRTRLYAAESLGLEMEYLAAADSMLMQRIMVRGPDDANGGLLYPDGEPRFRVVYTNGGRAGRHGTALGDTGRQRIRDFYHHGGSYTGSCAGAFIASLSSQDSGVVESYYHIWPGRTRCTNMFDVQTGHFVPISSPLLDYYDFGGDGYIDNVYHNGGCYANEVINYPPGTEVLLRYDTLGFPAHWKASCWAYKGADTTGRIVLVGSHPEGYSFGERLHLMMAMTQYALDGQGSPYVKAALANGVTRHMDRPTGDDPAYVMVGDRQYHHFAIDVHSRASNLTVTLNGNDSFDLNLYLKHEDFAFRSTADHADTSLGADKAIHLAEPAVGRWFVGVECATTVQAHLQGDSFYLYSGRTDVLDGVDYSITASWSPGGVADCPPVVRDRGLSAFPSPFRTVCEISVPPGAGDIEVYDMSGRQVASSRDRSLTRTRSGNRYRWQPGESVGAGVYLIRVRTGEASVTKRVVYLR